MPKMTMADICIVDSEELTAIPNTIGSTHGNTKHNWLQLD
jgi:hypothetical protein